jgi:ribosome maturation factor RimP
LGGRRNFTGVLVRYGDGILHLQVDGQEVGLSWPDVEKANLVYEYKSSVGERVS